LCVQEMAEGTDSESEEIREVRGEVAFTKFHGEDNLEVGVRLKDGSSRSFWFFHRTDEIAKTKERGENPAEYVADRALYQAVVRLGLKEGVAILVSFVDDDHPVNVVRVT
jgi:hypothetical protein